MSLTNIKQVEEILNKSKWVDFTIENVEEIIEGFIDCAQWSDEESYNVYMDMYHGDDNPLDVWIAQFLIDNEDDIAQYLGDRSCPMDEIPFELLGHDIWLTRRGHGTGFWDRDELTNNIGERLTAYCKQHEIV